MEYDKECHTGNIKAFECHYAEIKPICSSYFGSNKNHCIKGMSYPAISTICIGTVVMLLNKFIVEENL